MSLVLPNGWEPRAYQLPLWRFMENGGKRAVSVWHRRAGKDSCALNWTAVAMHQRVGTYWHMLPEKDQARKVIWEAIDRAGRRVIDQAFPEELRDSTRNNEMRIRMKNGSTWYCVGSDNYNSLVGSNPVGIVFSEYSVADPYAWDYLRPILAENGGWAVFLYTPRGRNHGARLYEMARGNQNWHAELLTVADTWGNGGCVSPEDVEAERAAGMDDQMIEQEFYCSFATGLSGAYYARLMAVLDAEGKVNAVPYDPAAVVDTAWDLGGGDDTALWFVQQGFGGEVNVIDFLRGSGQGLTHYVNSLRQRPYVYRHHYLPHDVEVKELTTGKSRLEFLKGLGLTGIKVVPKLPVDDGIQAVRMLLPRCRFDSVKCAEGLDALRSYQRAFDEKKRVHSDTPLHNWASDAADAFRYLAVGLRSPREGARVRPAYAEVW